MYDFMARIPYINLGYTPKEIGRLRVELTGIASSYGLTNGSLETEDLRIMEGTGQNTLQDMEYTT